MSLCGYLFRAPSSLVTEIFGRWPSRIAAEQSLSQPAFEGCLKQVEARSMHCDETVLYPCEPLALFGAPELCLLREGRSYESTTNLVQLFELRGNGEARVGRPLEVIPDEDQRRLGQRLFWLRKPLYPVAVRFGGASANLCGETQFLERLPTLPRDTVIRIDSRHPEGGELAIVIGHDRMRLASRWRRTLVSGKQTLSGDALDDLVLQAEPVGFNQGVSTVLRFLVTGAPSGCIDWTVVDSA